MSDRDFKGVWIPKEIWLDERMNALEKVILVEIDSLDSTDAHCWKSNENLAEFCQCSATKVSNAISKLIKLGYVKVHSFDGRKRRLQSCLTFSVGEPYKNCKADLQNLQASNTYSNPLSNPDRYKEEKDAHAREINPFGEDDGEAFDTDTVQAYALKHLMTLGYRAMEELNGYVDDLSEDVVRHAIDNALDKGVRNWSYVRAILNSYVEHDVRNIADAKAVDDSRKKGGSAKGSTDAQAEYDEDHRPRAVVPDPMEVDYIKDPDNPMALKMYVIRRTGEEVPFAMIRAMCPGEIERFWDSKHVRWHN